MEYKELTPMQALCAMLFNIVLFLLASMLCTIEAAGY